MWVAQLVLTQPLSEGRIPSLLDISPSSFAAEAGGSSQLQQHLRRGRGKDEGGAELAVLTL